MKAILRRQRAPTNARPGLVIDAEHHRAFANGKLLTLTPAEFRLLKAFADALGRVFSRDQLLDKLHDDSRALNDRTVDSHIKNLRRKLHQAFPEQEPIARSTGVGYQLEID